MTKRVVLAYSGGLDTSVAVKWMIEEMGVEVIALAVDVGQDGGNVDFEAVRNRALVAGAVEAEVIDAKQEFAEDFCVPALRANALYENRYPLVSALSRPVIVKHLVAAARRHGADAVAHGCTGKGNDQVRFEVSTRALAPDLDIVAPVRSWGLTREAAIRYAETRGIPITATKEKLYSIDDNLWGRAIECGEMEDPWAVPPPGVWSLTKPTETEPRDLVIGFDRGVPVSVDGEALDIATVIALRRSVRASVIPSTPPASSMRTCWLIFPFPVSTQPMTDPLVTAIGKPTSPGRDMKFFADTAEIDEIRDLAETGLLDGVTTNPSLVHKSGRDFVEVVKDIVKVCSGPVSAEVVALDFDGMMTQAEKLRKIADNVAIKVPLTEAGLKACRALTSDGTMVNVTLCFSAAQALLAAKAGATFISPFVGRHDDVGFSGMELISDIRLIYDNYDFETQILVASVRHPVHVVEAAKIGADVMTAPPKIIRQLFKHPLTDAGLAAFLKDWEASGQTI